MILEIPDQTQSEKRKFLRVFFKKAASYQLKDSQGFGGCLASDIGEGGIKIYFNDFVPLGTEMMLQIQLGQNFTFPVIDLMGRVVWIARDPRTDRYQIGLEFMETSSGISASQKIREYVRSHELRDSLAFSKEVTTPKAPAV